MSNGYQRATGESLPHRAAVVDISKDLTRTAVSPTFETPEGPSLKQKIINVLTGKSGDRSENFGLEKGSTKLFTMLSVLLMVVFMLIALSQIMGQRKESELSQSFVANSTTERLAAGVSDRLALHQSHLDAALAVGTSSQRVVNAGARMKGVIGTILMTLDGRVSAVSSPQMTDFAKEISVEDLQNTDMLVTSILNPDTSTMVPVIVKRQGSYLIANVLSNTALLPVTGSGRSLLLGPGGRLIDGPRDIAGDSPTQILGMSSDNLSTMLRQAPSGEIHSDHAPQTVDSAVGTNWVAARKVPDTGGSLSVVHLTRKNDPGFFTSSAFQFLLLFIATFTLLMFFLKNLTRQLQAVKQSQLDSQVSQQRFRAAVEGGRGGVWEMDMQNNTAFISASLAQLLGMPHAERTLNIPQFLGLFNETEREKLLTHARRAHINGEFDADVSVAHLPLVLSIRGRPSDRMGETPGKVIIGVAMDITEQRGAQNRLVAAETRLFDALSAMTDSFVIWDALNRIVLWNHRFEDFFGFQPGQIEQGMDAGTIEYHANRSIEDMVRTRDGNITNLEIKLKDGRWLRYIETATADGGQVSVGTEVTTIRQREFQLSENERALQKTVSVLKKSQVRIVELAENYEREKIRAEEANQSKSEFLANMSHELRTPLNAINGFSDIMKKEMFGPLGDPRYKEYVNDILFSGQHLLSLINDILDMSKIEAGKMSLNTEVLYMHDMIAQVVRILRGRADENRLKLLFDTQEVPEIEADPRYVKQILLNLMTNAIKFTPEGGTVSVQMIPKKTGIIVKVKDTGIGISQADIERLAQPFEQIESQHSKQHEGTGLGLALSKSLVELHGGNFKMESAVGEGTTVIFALPNKPPVSKQVQQDNVVSNEINRIAQDIADALNQDEVLVVTEKPAAPAVPAPQDARQAAAPTAPQPVPYTAVPYPGQAATAPQPIPNIQPVPYKPNEGTGRGVA